VELIEGDKNRHGAIPFQPFDNDSSDVVWANSGATHINKGTETGAVVVLRGDWFAVAVWTRRSVADVSAGMRDPRHSNSVRSRAFLIALLVRDRTRERVF
jgi:hypothetical protein